MRNFLIYYSLTLSIYIVEIILFSYFIDFYDLSVLLINGILRFFLVIIFTILVRMLVFKHTENFYIKFIPLIIINPLASSLMLSILVFLLDFKIIFLKIFADLIVSLILYFVMNRYS